MAGSISMYRRKLPKLIACMTKTSLDDMRNKTLYNLDLLDAKGIRRRRLPLHQCLILELREAGFYESADYMQDLIYDNIQLVAEDEIGIVIDLRIRDDYLEDISEGLKTAEKQRDKENTKDESLSFLELAMKYSERGKGILWLAEKFFLTSIAVASQYLLDGGRQKCCCKYHYATFLLDKFANADPDEPSQILTEVRDNAIGKGWLLYEPTKENEEVPSDTVFAASALQLHRVLLAEARAVRMKDPAKSERLSRLAERRAKDAEAPAKEAEAILEIGICQLKMNNLNNAQNTFERGLKIFSQCNNIEGVCSGKMYLASVLQRLGDHETASRLLTEMGALAMKNSLRKHLGRALHLLGELHLRREKPELGTQHLSEAFACFMGFSWKPDQEPVQTVKDKSLGVIYKQADTEIYYEEAEQSRFMMAVSAGQELMASYFNLIRESRSCAVSQMKCIEWKLSRASWWVRRVYHDYLPCMCAIHNRTPLDVLRNKLEMKAHSGVVAEDLSETNAFIGRAYTIDDIQKLRSNVDIEKC